MKTIRPAVFETNSSSCHSIVIMEDCDYKDIRTADKLVTDTYLDIEEHETITNTVDHDKVSSIESVLLTYGPIINKTKLDNIDEYDLPIARLIKDNWDENLLKVLFFGVDSSDLLKKAEEPEYESPYLDIDDIRDVLSRVFGINLCSYSTLFGEEEEVTVNGITQFWTQRGDCIDIIDTDINC